jgi:hypothetical protein
MHCVKLAVAGLLVASPALADDVEPTVGGGAAGATADGAVTVQATTLIARPYVVGSGKIGLYAAYEIRRSVRSVMMMDETFLDDGFTVGAGYGITPEITAGVQYGFRPGILSDEDSELSGPFALFGMYQLINDGSMNVTLTADFAYDLCGARDMGGDCLGTKAFAFGAAAKVKMTNDLAVFTGGPIGPGPLGQHFRFDLEEDGGSTFDLPAGVMFQATPDLGLYVATNLMRIEITDGDSAFFGADFIPIVLGGVFQLDPSMLVEAAVALPDAGAGIDAVGFTIGFRYYN